MVLNFKKYQIIILLIAITSIMCLRLCFSNSILYQIMSIITAFIFLATSYFSYKLYKKYQFKNNLLYVYLISLSLLVMSFSWGILIFELTVRFKNTFLIISGICIGSLYTLIDLYILKMFNSYINKRIWSFAFIVLVFLLLIGIVSFPVSYWVLNKQEFLYIVMPILVLMVVTLSLSLFSLVYFAVNWVYYLLLGTIFTINAIFFQLANTSNSFYIGQIFWCLGDMMIFFAFYELSVIKAENVLGIIFNDKNDIRSSLAIRIIVLVITTLVVMFLILLCFHVLSIKDFLLVPACITSFSLIFIGAFNKIFASTKRNFDEILNLIDAFKKNNVIKNHNFGTMEFDILQDFIINAFNHIKMLNEDKVNLQETSHINEIKTINENNKYHELLLKKRMLEDLARKDKQYRDNLSLLVHDIKSPTALINNIVEQSKKSHVLENDDIDALELANKRINFLTCRLLEDYKLTGTGTQKLYFNTYLLLNEIIFEFKVGYSAIKFDFIATDYARFSLLFGVPEILDRMLVNLIDNAVNATKNRLSPAVTAKLENGHNCIKISIKDNGCGMTQETRQKLLSGENIESTKINGSGVGFLQVYKALNIFDGKCEIISEVDCGTEFMITIPQYKQPQWFLRKIRLKHGQQIVILDDYVNIHALWEKIFLKYTEPLQLKIKAFEKISELKLFLREINYEQASDLLFLCDYDLGVADSSGIDVIKSLKIKNSILVTSNTENHEIQNMVANCEIKMLDKQMVSYIEIEEDCNSKIVDMVWLDDEDFFPKYIVKKAYKDLKVDIYKAPKDFLDNINNYHKETKIILDMYYELSDQTIYNKNGVDLAKELHDMGYINIIILTGELPDMFIPNYVRVILKNSEDVLLLNTL